MSVEQRLHRSQVVVVELHRHRFVRRWDPGLHLRARDKPVIDREEGLRPADSNKITTGRRPCELDRRRGDVRAILGELHHVRSRDLLEKLLGGTQLPDGRPREVDPLSRRVADSRHHRLIAVAERDSPQAHPILDEPVAIQVFDSRPSTAHQDRSHILRKLVRATCVRVRPARNQLMQACLREHGFLEHCPPGHSPCVMRATRFLPADRPNHYD